MFSDSLGLYPAEVRVFDSISDLLPSCGKTVRVMAPSGAGASSHIHTLVQSPPTLTRSLATRLVFANGTAHATQAETEKMIVS